MSPLAVLARRAWRAPALAALLAIAAASPAAAGSLTVDDGTGIISYHANAGEANDVSLYKLASGDNRIQDHGVASVPLAEIGGDKCTQEEPWKYRCPVAGFTALHVWLGDGADSFGDANSALDTVIWADSGAKGITTGAGDDTVNARNGSADTINCGAGDDTVVADADDSVDASCEHVSLPGEPTPTAASGDSTSTTSPTSGDTTSTDTNANANGSGNGEGAGNVFTTPVSLTVPPSAVPFTPKRALVALSCAADVAGGCHGDVLLSLPPGKAKKAASGKVVAARGHYIVQQRRGRKLGRGHFRIAAGKTAHVPVLLRSHYSLLSRRRRKHAVLKVVQRDAAGKVVSVQTRTVTLKLSNKWSRKRGHR